MANKNHELLSQLLKHFSEIDYAHPEDIPDIDLYMDQVLTFLDQRLDTVKRDDEEKSMTKTMINNYTKNQVLPAPEKKKYSREHMINLIFIYYLKNFLSIKDIKTVLDPINEKYFNSEDGLNVFDIYMEIVEKESSTANDLVKDVIKKHNASQKAFEDVAEEDREALQNFTFICLLAFDVFVKKMMIEQFIDGISPKTESTQKGKDK